MAEAVQLGLIVLVAWLAWLVYRSDNTTQCPLMCLDSEEELGLTLTSVQGRRSQVAVVAPIEIVDVEKVLLSIAPKDEDGKAVVAGPFTWTTSDEAVVTLEVAEDGLSAFAVSGGLGVATVAVTAGGLTDTIDITVKAGEPLSLNLSAGTPVHE